MGKKEIIIKNFGPIDNACIDLNKNFQIYIGAQASGKSTICKVIYFCQKLRDYTLDFLMDQEQFTENHPSEYYTNYMKYLTKQFMGCFGKTTHMQKFDIMYTLEKRKIRISLNPDGYVRFNFDAQTKREISALINEASNMFLNKLPEKVQSFLDSVFAITVMKRHMNEVLNRIFENEMEILYIPAGRSLLATMSEQLQDVSVNELDLTMQEFIRLIRRTKSRFGIKIPEMVKEYTKTIKGQINNTAIDSAYELIKRILKADYTSESDGEKIYFDEYHWVKLMYASSGQQEVLWILMIAFVTILEKRSVLW